MIEDKKITEIASEIDARVFRFEGVLQPMERIGGSYCVEFPWSVEELFGTKSSVRIVGTYNGILVDRALLPHGDGTHFLLMSRELCKKCGMVAGEKVKIEFKRHPNPKVIEMPEELEAVLDLEPGAFEKYDALNPGMKRNIVYWINSGKRPETREKRALEMLKRIVSGQFHMGGKKAKQQE